ncbi:MAG: helix-turn-helix domain-containing protein [Planctomycetia bacterium]|nr:helix-turn-helix domain-containing protein [Planctomycetia bacterium]
MPAPESPIGDVSLLDISAVAELLNCSPRHVRRLADTGKMPTPIKLGALLRFSRTDIDAWIAGGCKSVRSVPNGGVE